ncbi:hypothetical protein LINPERPRIM_LOCUS20747 [Linum perenne]
MSPDSETAADSTSRSCISS